MIPCSSPGARPPRPRSRLLPALAASAACAVLFACSGSSTSTPGPTDTPDGDTMMPPPGSDAAVADSNMPPPPMPDGAQPMPDSSGPLPPPDGGQPDGTPQRRQCTNSFGNALTQNFGRLDGYLVSIVPPGHSGCNGDQHHVHLQVSANNATYDVAIDIYSTQDPNPDVSILEISHALDGPAWSEGWHLSIQDDYVSTLGVKSTQFTEMQEAPLAAKIEADLANINHVSIYGTGYGPTGMHDIHRSSGGRDGAVVMYPLSNAPQWMLFHFSTQSF